MPQPPVPPPPYQLKISKKHHKHLNNPFPRPPTSLPFIHATLSNSIPNHQTFQIGNNFNLIWSPKNGGHLSITHHSNPNKPIWSTTPGLAFISAGVVHTEIEESRGSFAVKDGDVSLICHHQSVDEIRLYHKSDIERRCQNLGFLKFDQIKETQFPFLVVTGWVYSKMKKRKKRVVNKFCSLGRKRSVVGIIHSDRSLAARYWVILDQKNNHQIGFDVMFGEFNQKSSNRTHCRTPKWKLVRRKRVTTGCLNPRNFFFVGSDDGEGEGGGGGGGGEEEEEEERVGLVFKEFNRVFITYSSEKDERFYGFGEQFSRMEFKGKRVPIIVQEQGIGRGDQPISCAANLVSYSNAGKKEVLDLCWCIKT